MDTLILFLYAIAGAVIDSLLACVPALHIYNVAGILILAGGRLSGLMSGEQMAMFFLADHGLFDSQHDPFDFSFFPR